jgi:hypothetical protein
VRADPGSEQLKRPGTRGRTFGAPMLRCAHSAPVVRRAPSAGILA